MFLPQITVTTLFFAIFADVSFQLIVREAWSPKRLHKMTLLPSPHFFASRSRLAQPSPSTPYMIIIYLPPKSLRGCNGNICWAFCYPMFVITAKKTVCWSYTNNNIIKHQFGHKHNKYAYINGPYINHQVLDITSLFHTQPFIHQFPTQTLSSTVTHHHQLGSSISSISSIHRHT
jgi:hypothetical protein